MRCAARIAAARRILRSGALGICLIALLTFGVPARSAEPLPAPDDEHEIEVQRNYGAVELPPEQTRPAPTVRAYDEVYSPPIGWYGPWYGVGYAYPYGRYPYYGYPYRSVGIYGAWRGLYRPGYGLGYEYAPRSLYPSLPWNGGAWHDSAGWYDGAGWYDNELNRAATDAELLDRDPSALLYSPYAGPAYAPPPGAYEPRPDAPPAGSAIPPGHRRFYW